MLSGVGLGDTNLLFGILAVQLGLVSQQQLVNAGVLWTAQRERSLADILLEQHALTPRQRTLLDELLAAQVNQHGGETSEVYALYGGDAAAQESFGGSLVFDSADSGGQYISLGALSAGEVPGNAAQDLDEPSPTATPALPSSPGRSDLLPAELPGRYTMRGEQGRGGIGRVLIAFDESIRREIALKELLHGGVSSHSGSSGDGQSPLPRSSAQTTRFLREARITGQLEHPGIVPVYEIGRREDGTVYYTMKLVRGTTLTDKLKASRGLSDSLTLLPHFLDLCHAIAYAHARGVIHRDIKPANVMVGEFGETILLDWGLAKVKGQADEGAEKLADEVRQLKDADAATSVAGKPIGTPSYMPPEQADGRIADVDERSDVWSLGAVLYELLCGKPPFTGVSAFEVIGMVLSEDVPAVLVNAPHAPPELAAIAMRCLERDPARRYQSVEELADDISAFQTGGLVNAYSYSTGKMLRRWAQRHWPELATAGIALVLLLVLGTVGYRQVLKKNAALQTSQDVLLAFKLATESNQFLTESHHELANLLALEAAKYYGRSGTWMPEADAAIRDGASASPYCYDLMGHNGQVRRVAFSRDGALLASCGNDGTLRLWDMHNLGAAPRVLRGHEGGISSCTFSPDGRWLLSGSHDQTLRLWDVQTAKTVTVFKGPEGPVWAVAFSPDSKLIAAGGDVDLTIRVWDVAAPDRAPRLFAGHTGGIQALVFTPDGKQLISGSNDQTIRLWDLAASTPTSTTMWQGAEGALWLAVSPDDHNLAAACSKGSILLWDTHALLAAPRVVRGHEAGVLGVDFSVDGRHMVSGSMDKSIRIWDLGKLDKLPKIIGGLNESLWSVAYSPTGKLFASSSDLSSVRLWNLAPVAATPFPPLPAGTEPLRCVAFSRYGHQLAASGFDRTIRIWDTAALDRGPRMLHGHTDSVTTLAFSSDGRSLVSGSLDRTVRLWNLTQPDVPAVVFAGHEDQVRGVAFSPDGKLLASTGFDATVRLWDPQAPGKPPHILHGPTDPLLAVAFSPDGQFLAGGCADSNVWLWKLGALTTEPPQVLRGCEDVITTLAFSPDSSLLAAGSNDRTVRLWNLTAPSALPQVFRNHRGDVLSVTFSPDGHLLATACRDWEVRIWNLALPGGGPEILQGHDRGVFGVAFSPDSKRLASVGADALVHLWPVNALELVPQIEKQPHRNLTLDEWQHYVSPDIPYERTVDTLPAGLGAPGAPKAAGDTR